MTDMYGVFVGREKHVGRWRRDIEHVDSGLADMDLTDVEPRERTKMEIVGVGGYESFAFDKAVIEEGKHQDMTQNLGIEHKDHRSEQ